MGDTDNLKYVIDGELADLNYYINAERSDRYKAARIKREETDWCMYQLMQQHKGTSINYRAKYKFTWYTKSERKDPDNVAFAKKFVMDGFVAAKKIPDDKRKQVAGFSDDFAVDFHNPRVEIEIIPMEG